MKSLMVVAVSILTACSVRANAVNVEVQSYSGAVVIQRSSAPDAPLMIAIDNRGDEGRDGKADALYLFYTEGERPEFRFAAERVHVEDHGGKQLVLILDEKRRIIFTLQDSAIEAGPNDVAFTNGIGLARHWRGYVGEIGLDLEKQTLTNVCTAGRTTDWCP